MPTRVPFMPMVRAMTHAAPKIRTIHMTAPLRQVNRINRIPGQPGTVVLQAKPHRFEIQGDLTPDNIGREIIATLMRGTLGSYVQASENANRDGKDVILGIMDGADLEDRTVTLPLCVARELP